MKVAANPRHLARHISEFAFLNSVSKQNAKRCISKCAILVHDKSKQNAHHGLAVPSVNVVCLNSDLCRRQPLVTIVTTNSRVRPVILTGVKIFHAENTQTKQFTKLYFSNREICMCEKMKLSHLSLPICKWLWKATFAEGGEVQSVWFLVQPTRLDVQVLEYMHFSLETNLKHTYVHRVCLECELL